LLGVLIGLALPLSVVAGGLAWERWGAQLSGLDREAGQDVGIYVPFRLPRRAESPEPTRLIYLNREGARLTPGMDDARINRSSIVQGAELTSADVPAFAGTTRRWNQIVACVRDRFSRYNVRVVDQRPVNDDYVMAMVGGRSELLSGGALESDPSHQGHAHSVPTGLAPFNGQPIDDAVVFVFSRKLREHARRTCETIAMEVAHAYGLDHSRHCGEIMSYLRPCGRRSFMDRELACGELQDAPCDQSDATTQNSHRRLLELLGPAAR